MLYTEKKPVIRGRVVFLSNTIMGGGAEKQMLLIAGALQESGYHCSAHWLDGRDRQYAGKHLEETRSQGVEVQPPRDGRLFDTAQLFRVRAVLCTDPAAILWTWGYRADIVAVALRVMGCQNIIIGSLRSAFRERIQQHRYFWRVLGRTHDAFISNTHSNVEMVGEVAPRVPPKAAVIYNSVEQKYFTEPLVVPSVRPAELRIVMLGNQSIRTKGYDIAVELAARLEASGLPAKIVIGGVPSDFNELRRIVESRGVPVELAGHIETPAVFLRTGHVFLMLSRYEGTPNALLEAMALGLPAICTRVGDVAKFALPDMHLKLVDPTVEAALRAVRGLWEDWAGTIQMAAAGRELCARQFGVQTMLAKTISLLREIRETATHRVNT